MEKNETSLLTQIDDSSFHSNREIPQRNPQHDHSIFIYTASPLFFLILELTSAKIHFQYYLIRLWKNCSMNDWEWWCLLSNVRMILVTFFSNKFVGPVRRTLFQFDFLFQSMISSKRDFLRKLLIHIAYTFTSSFEAG